MNSMRLKLTLWDSIVFRTSLKKTICSTIVREQQFRQVIQSFMSISHNLL